MTRTPLRFLCARATGLSLFYAAVLVSGAPAASAQTANAPKATGTPSAVVVMYHRFGERTLPSTNIRIDQFETHIAEMRNGKYVLQPIPKIIDALQSGKPLPPRTLGISIDDAFLSAYREAWPRLRKAGIPFTLFIATDAIDRGGNGYMSWAQIRELAEAGVNIGSQTASHPHMSTLTPQKIKREFDKSNARFQKELGFRPRLMAYPYGETSRVVMAAARAAGFTASFGQHSGVLHGKSDFNYLPRFTLNEHYGNLNRFRLAANALPFFATGLTPTDPTLGPNPPAFGFTVGAEIKSLGRLACYSSTHGKLEILRLGKRRIEVRPPDAFAPGRSRINCTLPAKGGRWRWLGMQFFVPKK